MKTAINPQNSTSFQIEYGMPREIIFLLCIPLFTSVIAIGLPILAVLAWIGNDWLFLEQLHYSLVVITALGFIPFLHYWNLLGFRY